MKGLRRVQFLVLCCTHPFVPSHNETLRGDWFPVADALDKTIAHDGMSVLACGQGVALQLIGEPLFYELFPALSSHVSAHWQLWLQVCLPTIVSVTVFEVVRPTLVAILPVPTLPTGLGGGDFSS